MADSATPPMRITRSRARAAASVTPVTTTSTTASRATSKGSIPAGSRSAAPKLTRAQPKKAAEEINSDASLVAALPDDASSDRDQDSGVTAPVPLAPPAAASPPVSAASVSAEPSSASMGTPLLMVTAPVAGGPTKAAQLAPEQEVMATECDELEEQVAAVAPVAGQVAAPGGTGAEAAIDEAAAAGFEPPTAEEPEPTLMDITPSASQVEVETCERSEGDALVPSPITGLVTTGCLAPIQSPQPAAASPEASMEQQHDASEAAAATACVASLATVPLAAGGSLSSHYVVAAITGNAGIDSSSAMAAPICADAATPVPAKRPPTALLLSNTPQPARLGPTSPLSAARRTLTAIKPKLSAGATCVALTPSLCTTTCPNDATLALSACKPAGPTPTAAAAVRFQTPISAVGPCMDATAGMEASTAPGASTTARSSTSSKALKGALKHAGSVLGTPEPGEGDMAARATKSTKRVSISTPVHPKATSAPRHIVRTPYPKSASCNDDEPEEVEAFEGMGRKGTAGLDNSGSSGRDVAGRGGDEAIGVEIKAEVAATGAAGTEARMGSEVACEGGAEDEKQQDAGSDLEMSDVAPCAVAVVTADACRHERARAALQSMAQAEAQATIMAAAGLASPSASCGGVRSVPGYMAPTAAARMRNKAVVAELGSTNGVEASSSQHQHARAALPTVDPSMNQLRRQIKELAARKLASAAAASSKEVVQMDEVRKPHKQGKSSGLRKGVVAPSGTEELDPDVGDDGTEESRPDPASEAALTAAINTLSLGPVAKGPRSHLEPAPLKGLPAPQGTHVRFDKKGRVKVGRPGENAAVGLDLKGLPRATGQHLRFGDADE